MKLKIASLVSVVVLSALVGGFYGYTKLKGDGVFGASNASVDSTFNPTLDAYKSNGTQDIIGTHFGSTSTVGVVIMGNATSSYITKIGRNTDKATYQIKVTAVSSSNNNLAVLVEGSNDYLCDTQAPAASSTTNVTVDKINWYSIMDSLKGRVHSTSLNVSSTSQGYLGSALTAGVGNALQFVDLNYECLRFKASGNSTTIYVGLNLK